MVKKRAVKKENKKVNKKIRSHVRENADKKVKPASSNIKLIIVIIAVIICGIVLGFFYMTNFRIQSIKTVDTAVIVDNGAPAFNITNTSLNFGTIRPGGSGFRRFNIESDYKAVIRITVTGDMSKFLTFSENDFVLQPYENKTIQTNINIPGDTPLGEYHGKIMVYFLKS